MMDWLHFALARRAKRAATAPWWRGLACFMLLSSWLLLHSGDLAADADEAQVQAAFTLNFARFTEWPAARLANGRFTLCQLGGTERMADALQALEGRTVQGLPVQFQRIDSGLEASRCMVLFSAGLVPPPLADGAAVLTIGNEPGFAQHGGMIGLTRDGMRLRFEVNIGALRRAGLMLSSQVLALSANVIGGSAGAPGRP